MYALHLPGLWTEEGRAGVCPGLREGALVSPPAPMELAAARNLQPGRWTALDSERHTCSRRQSDPEPTQIEGAALETLNKLHRGVLLISPDGRVAFMNWAAEAMVGRRNGLTVRKHRLEFLARAQQIRYAEFLERMADQDGSTSLLLRVSGPRLHSPFRVLVSPLERSRDASSPSHCIFIYEPDAGRRPVPLQVLSRLYGLSPAEAKLTNELFGGKTVQRAAGALGITTNTARSTLKRVFTKCAVSSQVELMRLLSLGPRTL